MVVLHVGSQQVNGYVRKRPGAGKRPVFFMVIHWRVQAPDTRRFRCVVGLKIKPFVTPPCVPAFFDELAGHCIQARQPGVRHKLQGGGITRGEIPLSLGLG